MPPSNFKSDLTKEELLGNYLAPYYAQIFKETGYSIERITDLNLQYKGVDLILKKKKKLYYIDEKAQLDYLNMSLPTFAFEISYLKKENWHLGWLFDKRKITDIYFLVTEIYTKEDNNLKEGITQVKITGIYRKRLIALLEKKGLSEERIFKLEKEIRKKEEHGKIRIKELDAKKEGAYYFSKNNKKEQPINLVLKLDYLTENKVGKVLF